MNICPKCNTANPNTVKFCLQCAFSLPAEQGSSCPLCKQMVPRGNRFCGQCGTRMPTERYCTSCGHALPSDHRFCGQCGTAAVVADDAQASERTRIADPARDVRPGQTKATGEVSTNISPPISEAKRFSAKTGDELLSHFRLLMPTEMVHTVDASTHISGEQREVTVLFLDVTNFTAASHRLDSEDIYLIIDEAMRLLVDIVYKYEGTVDKFTGDGLIALFGAPIAHENDPERALRASLEMLQTLQPLRQRTLSQHNYDFQVRIGVNTGLAIAGRLGSDLHMEYTVIGDTVNMASRLESAAQPSSILVSFSTYQRTRPLFNFVAMPPLTMKGYSEPVRAYRPIQVREQPGSVRGLPGLRVQMVGRSRDLARLHQTIKSVQEQKTRKITLITGEAGLGKSRLVSEFCQELDAQHVAHYQGNCLAYARSRPMWVVAELIRNIVHITEIDPIEYQINQLRAFIAEHALDESSVLPVLSHILDLTPFEAEAVAHLHTADKDDFQSWVNDVLCQVLSVFRGAPYALIFDDLHWVDPASRDFIIHLIETDDEIPLHLILVSRDFERLTVLRPIVDVCLQRSETFEDIRLHALSVDESRLLVNRLVEQASPDIEELNEVIVTRAEGNPFYTEEIVRMLMDKGGIIAEQGDEWIATSRAKDLLRSVPGTLRGLILARFDQLPSDLRRTLQQAAVLGRSFPARLLAELYHGDVGVLLEHLRELTDRQFLLEDANSTELGFVFRHTLIQEAVYSTLLKRERRRLHGLAADVIKDINFWLPEEQADVLAYHYAESSEPDKAIPYLKGDGIQHPLFNPSNSLYHLSSYLSAD